MLEVVVESILDALNLGFGFVVLVEDLLAAFSPFLHGEGFVEDAAEDERGSCEICHNLLLSSDRVSLVGVEVLVDVVCDGLNSGVVGLVTVCV